MIDSHLSVWWMINRIHVNHNWEKILPSDWTLQNWPINRRIYWVQAIQWFMCHNHQLLCFYPNLYRVHQGWPIWPPSFKVSVSPHQFFSRIQIFWVPNGHFYPLGPNIICMHCTQLAKACNVPAVGVQVVNCWQWGSGHYFHHSFCEAQLSLKPQLKLSLSSIFTVRPPPPSGKV